MNCSAIHLNMDYPLHLFLASTRAFKRVCQEYNLSQSQLRCLLAIGALSEKQYDYVKPGKIAEVCMMDKHTAVYTALHYLVDHGLVARKKLDRGPTVADVYTLTGNGYNICLRFQLITKAEFD